MHYAGWIEQWGAGIQKILDECRRTGLPEPEWREDQGAIWLTFRKDIWTEDYLRSLGLNERQIQAVLCVKEKGRITNHEYQQLNKVSKATATRDLSDLVSRGLLRMEGSGKRGLYYVLAEPKMSPKWVR
ncbi:MAG: transcriptional regulator [Candidatus Latescibacterota bacterium]|nr:MAG: transcriptional regulator [Candidatus Latescibacterota bacterium]